jgi:antitoxin component of RelBE/YafQ-DinJ toxin-antitoxin module
MMSTVVLGTKVESSFAQRVEKYCQEMGITPSSLIRTLLQEEMQERAKLCRAFETVREEPPKTLNDGLADFVKQGQQTLERRILALEFLVCAAIEEVMFTQGSCLKLESYAHLQRYKGALASPEAQKAFENLERDAQRFASQLAKLKRVEKMLKEEEKK